MTHEGTKNIRTKFEEAIEKYALEDFPTPLNKEGYEMTIPAGHSTPHGFNKFKKAYKKGFLKGASISDQQSIEAMKWATWQGWNYLPSKDMWLGREGGNGKVMALNDSELLAQFKAEQEKQFKNK